MAKKENEKMSIHEYIEEKTKEANKRRKSQGKEPLTISQWYDSMVDNITKCQMVTHVSGFSNPSVRVNIFQKYDFHPDGYVVTRNIKCIQDITASTAAFLGAGAFLYVDIDEDYSVLKAVIDKADSLTEELNLLSLSIDRLEQETLNLLKRRYDGTEPEKTDGMLKQVYFPIKKNTYHLLSILPASCLLLEMKKRINKINEHQKSCYDTKSAIYGENCKSIVGMTKIEFGGNNPQNISTLIPKEHGTAYLLSSLPPSLPSNIVHLPKKDCFQEIFRYQEVKDIFAELSRFMRMRKNNLDIRQQINQIVNQLVDYAMGKVYTIRNVGPGWSDSEIYAALPKSQKVWLDDQYKKERKEGTLYRKRTSEQFARWITDFYKKSSIVLGNAEFQYFQDKMENVWKEEVRYNS